MIYVDVSAAVHSRAGLGRYCEGMALALNAEQPGRFNLFFNQGADGKLPTSLADIPHRSVNWGYKPWRMAVLMAHLSRRSFARLVPGVALYHSTEHLLFPLRDQPTVLSIHDLIFKLFPEYHKKLNYWYLNWAVPIFARNASAIIAVSEATKRDVVQHYGIDASKIHVVLEAAANHFSVPSAEKVAAVRQKYSLPENYLVHLSTIEPRKNLDRLIDALLTVRKTMPTVQLVLVGAKGWLYDDFFGRIQRENLQNTVHALGWVPDEDLAAVIAAAALAVQPSLYEGFGLPILEHMASGQVVAASNASSFPEVGGDAAAYFNPLDSNDMAQTILRLLADRDEYAHRRALGVVQASHFSWQRAARETIAIYDQLLG